jgi:acyl-CoA synthetase (NDP forming)
VLTAETQAKLRAILPAEAGISNPVDMLASGSAESYGQVMCLLMADPNIDSVIVLFIPPLVTEAAGVARALVAACDPPSAKPVVACFVGAHGIPDALRGATVIPSYTFPEAAARAMGHAAARAAWLRRPAGEIPVFADINQGAARAIVDAALAREARPWLTADEVREVLGAYAISTPQGRIARSADEAAAACRALGAPVAVKLVSRTVLHKSDVGGVHLGLGSPEAAAAAYDAIAASLKERGLENAMDGALVQPMLTEGVECLVGVVNDPIFGPLIAFGSGGVTAEVMGDVRFRLHPLTDVDADELIGSVKVAKLLHGFRGSPPADLPALRDLLLRVSRLVDDIPEIAEIDLNPVMVGPEHSGAVVVDARVRLTRMA